MALLKAVGLAGGDPFLARRALDEMASRSLRSALTGGRVELRLPGHLEVEPDRFLALEKATRADLISASSNVCRRYLARRQPRQYLLSVLFALVQLAPLLDGDQLAGDVLKTIG